MLCLDKIPIVPVLYLCLDENVIYLSDDQTILSSQEFESPEAASEMFPELLETMNADGASVRERGGHFPQFLPFNLSAAPRRPRL